MRRSITITTNLCQSNTDLANKWLKSSYFDFVGLKNLKPLLSKLSTQYRMPSKISNLVKPWYENNENPLYDYNDTITSAKLFSSEHKLNESDLIFIDTSKLNTYHSKSTDGSVYNLVNACIAAELIRELKEDFLYNGEIVYITPYRAQNNLALCILKRIL